MLYFTLVYFLYAHITDMNRCRGICVSQVKFQVGLGIIFLLHCVSVAVGLLFFRQCYLSII